ncbi:MAG: recombinase family protein [Balneolaceae bacterium]
MEQFVTYYRVSTKKQGDSGLGLDAQRETARQYLKANNGEEIETFTEIESGRNGNRPVLKSAIEKCKETGAKLLIAKLDRLSRNVAFLFNLKEELEQAGVGFVAADLPSADNTMVLGVMASVAQFEAERISQRIKEAIPQSPVYQSGNWGNPENLTDADRQKAYETISVKARTDPKIRQAFHFIQPRREQGMSYAKIAKLLNKEGYRTKSKDGKKFHPAQVRKIYLRFAGQSS